MERKIIITEDGSHSLYIPEMDENYHSVHGAIQESVHVFIKAGLRNCDKENINILEIGFGTGLNALLTLQEAIGSEKKIHYTGIEKYPLEKKEYEMLNYSEILGGEMTQYFLKMHESDWDVDIDISNNFALRKIKTDLTTYNFEKEACFDLVYFDAFAPNKQPGMWNTDIYSKIFETCTQGAIFVTYCAKGIVRRELQSVGFKVERMEGPPGKFEMIRAIKP